MWIFDSIRHLPGDLLDWFFLEDDWDLVMEGRWTEGPGGYEFGSVAASTEKTMQDETLVIITPPNTNPEINILWAFVSVDEGGEGVIAMRSNGAWFPLVTSEESMLPSMRKWARQVARGTDMRVRLIKLTAREVVEELS